MQKVPVLKKLIPLADAHQAADEYISGDYWLRGKGCAVGCTVHDAKALKFLPKNCDAGDHAALAAATGVPEMLWILADNIFEGLAETERSAWTPRFLRAAKSCKKIDSVPARVTARLAERLAEDATREDVRAACRLNAGLWDRRADGNDPSDEEWDAARQQAYAARQQADAARQQAYAARQQAYAAWQQADAACQQADAACKQADAACQQADAARQQAYAAWQQAYAAWQQAYAACQQADAARQQADAAWQQADAARQQWWAWCAEVVIGELSARREG
jgi:hypothetical protein